MRTLLDEFHTAFLHAILFDGGELRVLIAEGFKIGAPSDITVGGVLIKNSNALDTSPSSRLFEARFPKPVAWQVVDESFTTGDDYEVRDDSGKLQVMTRSKYLDYVHAAHGWFEDVRGSGKHYRIWTENEVIDVVTCDAPLIGLIT